MRSRWNFMVVALVAAGCPDREPVDHTEPALSMCSFDAAEDPDRIVLATVIDRELVFVAADGSRRSIARLGGAREPAWLTPTVDARDGFVLVTAMFDEPPGGTAFEISLYDLDGRLRWRRLAEPGVYEARLGERGVVALASYAGESAVAFPDGSIATIGRFIPIGAPLADGSVPVRAQSWGPSTFGWIAPGDDALTPPAYPEGTTGDPIVWNGALVYLAQDAGEWIVAIETPQRVATIPASVVADTYYCTLGIPNADGWVVIREGWEGIPVAAVDLARGEVTRLSVSIPEGLRPFHYGYSPVPGIDGDGALLLGLRDEFAGALYRSTDGHDWRPIGRAVSQVMAVEADTRGGTYAILGTNARYSWEDWPAPPADRAPELVGDALQVVRPEDGVVHTLPAPYDLWISSTVAAPMMSDDGNCIAYWDAPADRMPTLHVLEVATGERFDLGGPVTGTGPSAIAWIAITSATR